MELLYGVLAIFFAFIAVISVMYGYITITLRTLMWFTGGGIYIIAIIPIIIGIIASSVTGVLYFGG